MMNFMAPLDMLLESAPLARQMAPRLCRRDSATGESCAWIHGLWQYLRLLGLASTPDTCDITVLARVPEAMCQVINKSARVTGPMPTNGWASVEFPPQGWTTIGAGFPGSCVGVGQGGGGDDALKGKSVGCYKSLTDGKYYFYNVLLVR